MTDLIPDSWELPSYLAGDLYDLDAHRALLDYARGGPREMYEGPGSVLPFRGAQPAPEPSSEWADAAQRMRENPIEPYDPDKHGFGADLMSVDSQHALEGEGFFEHEPGVWHRHVTSESGEPMAGAHILTYEPGNRRPTNNERAPWILSTDPESVGLAFRSLHGSDGAFAAANEDRAQIRRMSKAFDFSRDPSWESA